MVKTSTEKKIAEAIFFLSTENPRIVRGFKIASAMNRVFI